MADTKEVKQPNDVEQFLKAVDDNAKQAEANSLVLQGRAQAFRDICKFVKDNNMIIIIPKSKKEGDVQ